MYRVVENVAWVLYTLSLFLLAPPPCPAATYTVDDDAPADFNENGMVDFNDYGFLSATWLTGPNDSTWNPLCNISQPTDDIINALDLSAYCNEWLWQAWWHEP